MPEANPQKVIQAETKGGGSLMQLLAQPEARRVLAEFVRGVESGRFRLARVFYKKGDGYYVNIGSGFPREYDILAVEPGRVVYRLGEGPRKALRPSRSATWLRVPAEARPREGLALAEFIDDRVVVVWLSLG